MLLDVKSDSATLKPAGGENTTAARGVQNQARDAPPAAVQQNVARVEATVYDAALAVEVGQAHEHLVHHGADAKRGQHGRQ
jgi:hypothetical protein